MAVTAEKRTATAGVVGRLLLLRAQVQVINGPSPFRAGKSTERRNTHQELASEIWANTSGLDCADLGKPINEVPRQHSWQAYMGQPMVQKVPGTCVLAACIVCLQAVHRMEYEKLHGEGGFPWHCMDTALRRLFVKCVTHDTWVWGRGANVGKVLNKIKEIGVGWHSCVCVGYRFRGGEMHVLVLDNHKATGPQRWVHVKEFHALYSLSV